MKATDLAQAAKLLTEVHFCIRRLEAILHRELVVARQSGPSEHSPEFEVSAILWETASYFGITVKQLLERGQRANVAHRRAVAMYVARQSNLTWTVIAKAFRTDHSSALRLVASHASDERLLAAATAINECLLRKGKMPPAGCPRVPEKVSA